MIHFVERPEKLNKDCIDLYGSAEDGWYCKNRDICEIMEAVEVTPDLISCKGCFNYGKSTRLLPAPEKRKDKKLKDKKKNRKKNKKKNKEKNNKADEEVQVIPSRKRKFKTKKKSRIQKFGNRK